MNWNYFTKDVVQKWLNSLGEVRKNISNIGTLFKRSAICEVVGLIPYKLVTPKTNVAESSTFFVRYLVSMIDSNDEECIYSRALRCFDHNKVVVRGGASAMINNLVLMSTPPKAEFGFDILLKAVSLRLRYLNLPYMGPIGDTNISKTRINCSSFSGYLCTLFTGSTKLDAFSFCYPIANYLFDLLKKKRIYCLSL